MLASITDLPANYPVELRARAENLVHAKDEALSSPVSNQGVAGTSRTGIATLGAVLAEAQALASVKDLMPRIALLEIELRNHAPAIGRTDLSTKERAEEKIRIQAVLALDGLRTHPSHVTDVLDLDLPRPLSARQAITWGDRLSLAVATIVVIAGGMSALYAGKAWGTWWDIGGMVIAGLAGSLALTPLFEALDRLSDDRGGPPATTSSPRASVRV